MPPPIDNHQSLDVMNHPEREKWVPYLYGEASPELRRELKSHLEVCARCREEVAVWQRSVRRLDAWKLRPQRKPSELLVPALKWAAAAVLVLALGFGLGRVSAAKSDVAQLRRELAGMVRDEVSRSTPATVATARSEATRLLADYAATLDTRREADFQVIRTALNRLELQNISLKKELDTVAVNTDAGLEQTEQQLAQLAVYRPPGNNPESQK